MAKSIVESDSPTTKLFVRRGKHHDAIREIDRKIQEIEKDQRIKRLSGYVGKYFKSVDRNATYTEVFYVVGISKDTLRNRVYRVIENGNSDDVWLTFEEGDLGYDMGEQKPCSKREFDRILDKIRERVEGYNLNSWRSMNKGE